MATHTGREHQPHLAQPVQVGSYTIYAAGTDYPMQPEHFREIDVIVHFGWGAFPPSWKPMCRGAMIMHVPWENPDSAPSNLRAHLDSIMPEFLQQGDRILVFCTDGHGQTGVLIACLIALLESPAETPDPVLAVRERYCLHAVATAEQEQIVRAMRQPRSPTYRQ